MDLLNTEERARLGREWKVVFKSLCVRETRRAMLALGLRRMQQAALRRLASPASQMAFRVGLAVQIEIRAARTSLGAYVRLLSSHLHSMLRALIPGAVMPHSIRVLTCQAKP